MADKNFVAKWDVSGERWFETGVSRGMIYPQSTTGTYPKGVVWNGLTQFSYNPDGADPEDFWADNIKYASLRGAENGKASLQCYTFPEEFEKCNGFDNIAVGVQIGQQTRKAFGFSCRTEIGNDVNADDAGYKIHIVYNATSSPSEMSYETKNESPSAIEFSFDLEMLPVNVTGFKPTSYLTIDSRRIDPEKLKALELILYGEEDTTNNTHVDPRLPLPDEIITLVG